MIASALAAAPRWNAARMQKFAPPLALAALALAEAVWAFALGYRFAGFAPVLLGVGILAIVALAYGVSGRSDALSNMAYFATLWIALSLVGVIFTYMATTLALPLLDATFERIDLRLGFDWVGFYRAVNLHPVANGVLRLAYASLLPQILAAILYFAATGRDDRSYELWWTAFATLAVTAVLSGWFPAAGTFHHYAMGLDRAVHLPHFFALRDGSVLHFVVGQLQGIVTFPSYHVVLAILFTYAYRGTRFFVAAATLNTLMLVSTPIYGGHYLVDMIGGGLLAALSIWALRRGAAKEG